MANYGRDDLENSKNASNVAMAGGLLATVLLGLGAVSESKKKNNRKDELDRQIRKLDAEISELSSGLFGSWVHSDEIEEKKRKRKELQKEYDSIK
jgi:hypothetical protein